MIRSHDLHNGIFSLIFLLATVGFCQELIIGAYNVESANGDYHRRDPDGGFRDNVNIAHDYLSIVGLFNGDEDLELIVAEVGGLLFCV